MKRERKVTYYFNSVEEEKRIPLIQFIRKTTSRDTTIEDFQNEDCTYNIEVISDKKEKAIEALNKLGWNFYRKYEETKIDFF